MCREQRHMAVAIRVSVAQDQRRLVPLLASFAAISPQWLLRRGSGQGRQEAVLVLGRAAAHDEVTVCERIAAIPRLSELGLAEESRPDLGAIPPGFRGSVCERLERWSGCGSCKRGRHLSHCSRFTSSFRVRARHSLGDLRRAGLHGPWLDALTPTRVIDKSRAHSRMSSAIEDPLQTGHWPRAFIQHQFSQSHAQPSWSSNSVWPAWLHPAAANDITHNTTSSSPTPGTTSIRIAPSSHRAKDLTHFQDRSRLETTRGTRHVQSHPAASGWRSARRAETKGYQARRQPGQVLAGRGRAAE